MLELQQHEYDCGPATVKAVLSIVGIRASKKTISKIAKTTKADGTDSAGILSCLEYYKLNFSVKQSPDKEKAFSFITQASIAIICTQNWSHWAVKIGQFKDRILIFDPESGVIPMSKRELLKEWQVTNGEFYLIEITP